MTFQGAVIREQGVTFDGGLRGQRFDEFAVEKGNHIALALLKL